MGSTDKDIDEISNSDWENNEDEYKEEYDYKSNISNPESGPYRNKTNASTPFDAASSCNVMLLIKYLVWGLIPDG